MSKSTKRIRLEKEIFSKSIQDIEKMFNFGHNDEDEPLRRKMQPSSTPSAVFNRLDVPAGTLRFTDFDYDCINPHLMQSDTNSESNDSVLPPLLPLSTLIPGAISMYTLPGGALLDFNDDEDVEDYEFEHEKHFMPRINLEKDLKMIDTMLSRPLQILG